MNFIKKNKIFFLSLLITIIVVVTIFALKSSPAHQSSKTTPSQTNQAEPGTSFQPYVGEPTLDILGDSQAYSRNGLITLASTDEPAVFLDGYNISADAEVSLYQTDQNALLNFLIHDKDGKQLYKNPDTNGFQLVTTLKQKVNSDSNKFAKVTLPLTESGIWYLKAKTDKASAEAFILRTDSGIMTKDAKDELIFWSESFKTKRSLTEGSIKILNLEDKIQELQKTSFDTNGIAKTSLNVAADLALVEQKSGIAVVPLNLNSLGGGYYRSNYGVASQDSKYFIFTDRPIYKPGDTVYFKAILRNDDDARYTIPGGQATAKIYYNWDKNNTVMNKTLNISSDGTVSGEYVLDKSVTVGSYSLSVEMPSQTAYAGTADFSVEFYEKPEYSLDVTIPKTELISGDKTDLTFKGTYFSGQPVSDQEVKYTIYSHDFSEYQYLQDQQNFAKISNNDFQYNYGQNKKIKEGTAKLNQDGTADIVLDTSLVGGDGKNKILSIEATITNGSARPALSRKNILVYAGQYGIYRTDQSYGGQVNTNISLPLTLLPNIGATGVSNIGLTAKIHREMWIPYQEPDKKYPSYKKEEEDLPSIKTTTNASGNATFSFTPQKTGSYTLTVESHDAKNNLVSKVFYIYISAEGQPAYDKDQTKDITVTLDKQNYKPNEVVHAVINSAIADRDVFLSIERGRVERYEIVHLNGTTGSVDLPLQNDDMPNVFAVVSSFSNNQLSSSQKKISVSTETKDLVVKISPENKTYGPGETATVNLATTNLSGQPVSADLAFWAIDKAILELSDSNLQDIFKTFWDERYISTKTSNSLIGIGTGGAEGGGCFVGGTQILMANSKTKTIEKVKPGDFILTRSEDGAKLVKAKVTAVHQAEESSHLVVNGSLHLTANHILRVNNHWQEAGRIQISDYLLNSFGGKVPVSSIESLTGQVSVYNLEIEKQHTFFANGFWVHNQKGGGDTRQTFQDTAYWNANIHTDAAGHAQVSFKLPDNLTTWAMLAVATTPETQVGQTTNEITVTKSVIVRPILPNILRVGDEAMVAGLVQNFTSEDLNFNLGLKFNAGTVEKDSISNLAIKTNKMKEVFWKIKATVEKDQAELNFSAISQTNKQFADSIISKIPIRGFGFEEKNASFNEGSKTSTIKLQSDSQKDKTKITLSLAPNLLGTLPSAMKYLLNYPYGCVEQTVSRLAPAIMAKNNQNLFGEALSDKNLDEIIQQSLARLSKQQLNDGGWPWWFSGKSDPYISAYVIENLVAAKTLGFKVDEAMMTNARYYATSKSDNDGINGKVAKAYGMAILNEKDKFEKITDFNSLSPDNLSLAVMANYLSGETDANKNGLTKLESLAQTQGDSVYFQAGDKSNFGSIDASTALAIRAILLAHGNNDLAIRSARYLAQDRQTDYWSNTFATAQVAKALVDLSKINNASTPNYGYSVSLNGKILNQGRVTNANQVIKDIPISANDIKADGSSLVVTKDGDGQLYSNLTVDEWRTDRTALALSRGLSVQREYVNEKGKNKPLSLGDTVLVKITVSGLKLPINYGVINDELPAGLSPINTSLKNEQYGANNDAYYTSLDVTDQEVTENGVILSLYQMAPGKKTYTYKARVTSLGTFIAPPATVSLMYSPEIYGRSAVQTVKIDKQINILVRPNITSIVSLILTGLITIIVLVMFLWLGKKIVTKLFNKKSH